MSNLIQEVISPGLLKITLNRPEAFNSLSEALLGELSTTLSFISKNTGTRVIILAANGKAFCAGHDLKEMMQEPSETYYQSLFKMC
ncbi:MAG: enoyl-CoA hydratase-related protein, partial [Burkholderiaceae bacterium]